MIDLTLFDAFAFAYFVAAWGTYAWLVEIWSGGRTGLTASMAIYRKRWM